MSSSDVEHLGVMAWASQFRNVPPRPPVHDMLRVALDSTSGRVGEPVSKLSSSIMQIKTIVKLLDCKVKNLVSVRLVYN